MPTERSAKERSMDERRLELFFLNSYFPELNSGEYLNGDLMAPMSVEKPVESEKQLNGKALSQRRSIQEQPERLQSYLKANSGRYAA